ncbi:MAG: MBL fold metallo-hydrolase [Pseudomonadales bacterium]
MSDPADKSNSSATGISASSGIQVEPFFDNETFSYTYVVWDSASRQAAVIDAVYDFDPFSGKLSDANADRVVEFITEHGLELTWILETHVHADHLSAAQLLKSRLGGRIGIGADIGKVQCVFAKVFNLENFACDGAQFDELLTEDSTLALGEHPIQVLATPGHTPACVSYLIDGNVFVGDTLFMPDYGTARTDFPGGCAARLYRSIQKLLALPEDTRMYMCHDYGTDQRKTFTCQTTVAEQRANNIHVGHPHSAEDFVAFRRNRDAQLSAPRLLYPAVQFNMRAGQLPRAEANGTHYFKIPIKQTSM